MNSCLRCGIDEAGRGPVAGPVYAGAVILSQDFPLEILNDSKKMSEKKRIEAEKLILKHCCWGLGFVDHNTIDKINILQASLLAMKLAFEQMKEKFPDFCKREFGNNRNISMIAIIDGTFTPNISIFCKALPKADSLYPEVMAAAIIAKNERDRVMIEYGKSYPEYGYEKHKGYLTKAHKEILQKLGPSPIQRKSFKY